MQLSFRTLDIENFGCFVGKHSLDLTQQGLIYVSGSNLVEPDLTTNGVGKSTIFSAILWILFGRTFRASRPGSSIESWEMEGVSTVGKLAFSCDNLGHRIERRRHPNLLTLDGEVVEQEKIDQLLSLSFEALTNTLIIGQFSSMFLSLRPEQQSALFTELLNLDIWNEGSDRASKIFRSKESEFQTVGTKISNLEGQQEALNFQSSQTQILSNEWTISRDAKEAELRAEHATATTELERAKEAARARVDAIKLERAIGVAENTLQQQRAAQSVLARSAFSLDTNVASLKTEIRILKEEYQKYDKSEGATCPACGQIVSKNHLEAKAKVLGNNIDLKNKKLIDIVNQLKELDKKISLANENVRLQEDALNVMRREAHEAQRINFTLTSRKERADVEVRRLAALLNDFAREENPHTKTILNIANKLQLIADQIKAANKTRETLERDVFRYKYWVDAYKQIKLQLIDETLLELEVAANRAAERLGLSGWLIKFQTERETAKGEVRSKFTVLLYPPNQEEAIPYECFSGGESQRWNIACIFALSDVLLAKSGVECNLRVLDEPTRGMSEAGVDILLAYLREWSHEQGLSVWFIDHHSYDSGYFDKFLFVTKDANGSRFAWQ